MVTSRGFVSKGTEDPEASCLDVGTDFDLLNLSVTSQGHASVFPTMSYEGWPDIYVGENFNLGDSNANQGVF